jgi:hypothetical protein
VPKMMGTVFSALTVAAVLAVLTFVWINRAAQGIVTATIPVAVAAISAIGLVFVFNRPAPISRVFPVLFAIERASLLPIVIPHRPVWIGLGLADQMRQIEPKTFEFPPDKRGFESLLPLYHEFLQRLIVDTIAGKHSGTWRVRIERFDEFEQYGPAPDAAAESSQVLSQEEIAKAFGKNRFAPVYSSFGKLALPSGTSLTIELSRGEASDTGKIRLKNWFCELTIGTEPSWSVVGLGKYGMLLGMPQDEAQKTYLTLQYLVRIRAEFPWYLVGHPKMALHREWAQTIVDDLAHTFDEVSLWSRTRENYILHQHLPPAAKAIPLPLGPIQSVKK